MAQMNPHRLSHRSLFHVFNPFHKETPMTRTQRSTVTATALTALAALVLGFAGSAQAATISTEGSVEGAEVTDWRSTGTAKTNDIDGDDVFGSSIGAVQWTVIGVNQQPTGSSTLGWAFVSQLAGNDSQTDWPEIDDASEPVSAAVADTDASIKLDGFTFELTGTASDYAGQTVRVSVMHDLLNPFGQSNDTNKGLQIQQTVGGSGDSGVVNVRNGNAGDGVPEFYFFDITDVSPGDQFQVLGLNNVGGTSGNRGYVGPVAFDIVPEPASGAMIGLGGLMLLARRRRA